VNTRSWVNETDRFVVIRTEQTKCGDLRLELSNGYEILVFPASQRLEAWRFFAPESDDDHLVFPTAAGDFGISRRKAARMPESEVWLRVIEGPKPGNAMQAPPPVILASNGTHYRCGRCGTVLAIAEIGALQDFVIHCRQCNRYNEVPL